MKKRIIFLFFAVFFLIACGKEKSPPLKIGINPWVGYAYAYIANEKNFELVPFKNYAECLEAYNNGKLDGIFGVFSDMILSEAHGLPTKIVWVTDYSDTADVIVARPEIRSMADLRGKRVGIGGLNNFSHILSFELLKKAGLKESEMRFEIVPENEVIPELKSGKVFAAHTWDPTKSRAIGEGFHVIANAGQADMPIVDVLAFTRAVVDSRRKDVRAVVSAMINARDYLDRQPAEAKAMIAKGAGMTIQEVDEGLGGIRLLTAMANFEQMKKLSAIGDFIREFYLNRGQITKMPDINSMIDPSFIEGRE